MEYHKDQFIHSDRMAYLQAPLAIQAAHAWLIRYCARRETGGTIAACKGWRDREWGIATNGQLRARDVATAIDLGLAVWHGTDLVVSGYDVTGERECLRERERLRLWRLARKGPVVDQDDDATESRTRTRKRAVPVRAPDQSSPDQSRPVQQQPGGDPPDPLAAAVSAAGGHLTDPKDGTDLLPQWRSAAAGLTLAEVATVFGSGPVRLGHMIRFPSSFLEVRTRLDEDRAAAVRRAAAHADTARLSGSKGKDIERETDRQEAAAAAAEPFARIVQFIQAADVDTLDRIGMDLASTSVGRGIFDRIARAEVVKPTAVNLGYLTKSPTLAAIADGRQPEVA